MDPQVRKLQQGIVRCKEKVQQLIEQQDIYLAVLDPDNYQYQARLPAGFKPGSEQAAPAEAGAIGTGVWANFMDSNILLESNRPTKWYCRGHVFH
ncbi:MAG: hypothetical protein Q7J85_12395 [Bacillota bacterium]|nr:hypothetical protein [Bacillota bacterium]